MDDGRSATFGPPGVDKIDVSRIGDRDMCFHFIRFRRCDPSWGEAGYLFLDFACDHHQHLSLRPRKRPVGKNRKVQGLAISRNNA